MKYSYFCSPQYSNVSLENSISWSFQAKTRVSQYLLFSSILGFALLVLSTQDRETPSITFFLHAKMPTLAGQGSEGCTDWRRGHSCPEWWWLYLTRAMCWLSRRAHHQVQFSVFESYLRQASCLMWQRVSNLWFIALQTREGVIFWSSLLRSISKLYRRPCVSEIMKPSCQNLLCLFLLPSQRTQRKLGFQNK